MPDLCKSVIFYEKLYMKSAFTSFYKVEKKEYIPHFRSHSKHCLSEGITELQ